MKKKMPRSKMYEQSGVNMGALVGSGATGSGH